ncbi:MAG: helix-turn-helix domain-containing protein [Actinobacteria bacterium]|nr:helix-turn-helix domain-containing protein [Actinomycetota bacterium]MBU1609492.1 helix-turn-helix domain-containing protein [Actinomycetota bacterium]MBU2315327.1 helix-turn-helix domain-containing protein [Actinomycetota bacterium]MBU2385525.1 helix-turn-helix domain-containing protein [Actinomycetota bacterium]
MVQRVSPRQQRLLREFGAHIRRWRKVNGMTAVELSRRAFVTRETLRHIESGTGAPRLDSLIAVLAALGIADTIVGAADPYKSEAARARIDAIIGEGGSL